MNLSSLHIPVKNLRIALPTSRGLLLIPTNQIIRIQSISNYSKLYLASGKTAAVAKVLRWFEENPELVGFLRIHCAHLVNPHYIDNCGVRYSDLVFLSYGAS